MTEKGPLGTAEERMGLNVRCTGAGSYSTEFIFDKKFADQ